MLSLTEFVIRLAAKLLLIASVLVLIIGGFAVEGDSVFATRMIVAGIAMAVPEIAVWVVTGLSDEKE